jgi:hypothetical protein
MKSAMGGRGLLANRSVKRHDSGSRRRSTGLRRSRPDRLPLRCCATSQTVVRLASLVVVLPASLQRRNIKATLLLCSNTTLQLCGDTENVDLHGTDTLDHSCPCGAAMS